MEIYSYDFIYVIIHYSNLSFTGVEMRMYVKIFLSVIIFIFTSSTLFSQTVIKYPLQDSRTEIAAGIAVRLNSSGQIVVCDSNDVNIIGFIIDKENVSGTIYYNVVNSDATEAFLRAGVKMGDKLTVAAGGTLKVLQPSEMIVGFALEDGPASGAAQRRKIMITLDATLTGNFIWNQDTSAQLGNYWISGDSKTDGNDSIGGNLTVEGAAVINDAGGANDFRVEGDHDQNLIFSDAASDWLGIGTSTPTAKLDVCGHARIRKVPPGGIKDSILTIDEDGNIRSINFNQLEDKDWTRSGNLLYTYNTSDSVGIGTSSPGAKLDVRGDAIFNEDGGNFDFRVEGNSIENLLFVDASENNVGIGTNSPDYLLDVDGAIRSGTNGTDGQFRLFSEQGGTDYEVVFNPNASMTQNVIYTLPPNDGDADQILTTDGGGALTWEDATGADNDWAWSSGSGLTGDIYHTGDIGIGHSSNPTAKLDVRGSAVFNEDGGDFDFRIESDDLTNMLFIDASENLIGVGYPPVTGGAFQYSIFQISDEDGSNSDWFFRVAGGGWPVINFCKTRGSLTTPATTQSTDHLGSITAWGYSGGDYRSTAEIAFDADGNTSTGMPSRIDFWTTPVGSYTPQRRMRLNNAGRLGINTDGPDRRLDVLESSDPQLRLTQSDGADYTDFQTTSSGYLYINPSGNRVGIDESNPETNLHIYENNAETEPAQRIEQDGSGDASHRFQLTGGQNISIGIDNNDNDNFEISNTTNLTGTAYNDANTMMRIHTESGSQGIIDFNNQSRACAYRSSNQTCASVSWVTVTFNAEEYDEQSEFNTGNGRFTADQEGYYQVNSSVNMSLLAGPGPISVYEYRISIFRSSSEYKTVYYTVLPQVGSIRRISLHISSVVYLRVEQYIEIRVRHNTGSSRTIYSGQAYTWVNIHKIS